MDPHLGAADQKRMAYVIVPVAHIGEDNSLCLPEFFLNGKNIGQRLAGMMHVREAVNNRYGSMLCQIHNILMRERAGHDAFQVSGKRLGHVRRRFAYAEIDLVGAEINTVPAQLKNSHLEGNARAVRRFLEYQPDRLSAQMLAPVDPVTF